MNYDQFGILSIDSFENFLLLTLNDDTETIKTLVSSFRKLIESICAKAEIGDFKYCFNVWKTLLTTESKNITQAFFKEFIENWTFYSSIFDKTDEIFHDYCTVMETLSVLNRLLTICLENFVFNSSFDRTKFVELSKFAQTFLSRFNFSILSTGKSRWFGGISLKNSSSNYDTCLRRILILIQMKCETISNNNSSFVRLDFGLDAQSVVDLFLDQDDQLCELLLCNFLLAK